MVHGSYGTVLYRIRLRRRSEVKWRLLSGVANYLFEIIHPSEVEVEVEVLLHGE